MKLFISHSSEDKDDFVHPLAEALRRHFEVWVLFGCGYAWPSRTVLSAAGHPVLDIFWVPAE